MIDLEHLNQARMLALKLSTLQPEDYQWIQDNAPPDALNTLNPLIEEIRQLNFGLQYPELIALLKLNSKNEAVKQKSMHELMNDLHFDDVLKLFKHEADALLPLFSTLHEWQWKSSPKFIEYRKRRNHHFNDSWGERPLLKEALLNIVGDLLLNEEHHANPKAIHRWARLTDVMRARLINFIGKLKH